MNALRDFHAVVVALLARDSLNGCAATSPNAPWRESRDDKVPLLGVAGTARRSTVSLEPFMPKRIVPGAKYYSHADEASFFARLESISGVVNIKGTGRVLEVTLPSKRLSRLALQELPALHYRYRISMRAWSGPST
jgi:hypothetical protein